MYCMKGVELALQTPTEASTIALVSTNPLISDPLVVGVYVYLLSSFLPGSHLR